MLLQDVPKVGQKNDVKSVKFGFAKNWLIPKKLASLATPSIIAQRNHEKALKEGRQKKEDEAYAKLIGKIEALRLTFKPRKTAKGTLYAALDTQKIAERLKKEDVAVDSKHIALAEPIKKVGEYEIPIVFSEALRTKLKVMIQ